MTNNLEDKYQLLAEAAKHLQAAVALLDEADAPAHIAAHVDLAANQIQDVIAPIDGVDRRNARSGAASIRVV